MRAWGFGPQNPGIGFFNSLTGRVLPRPVFDWLLNPGFMAGLVGSPRPPMIAFAICPRRCYINLNNTLVLTPPGGPGSKGLFAAAFGFSGAKPGAGASSCADTNRTCFNMGGPLLFPMIFLAGLVDAIAGGGGLISLPSYYASGVAAHTALGSNKFSSSLSTLAASVQYVKNGCVNIPIALVSGVFAVAGSALGARLSLFVSGKGIGLLMIALTPLIAAFTLFKKDFGAASKQRLFGFSLYAVCAGLGLLLGAYDGFFGPGTGTFWIIALTSAIGLDAVQSNGTAKLANLASNIGALVTFALSGKIDYALAAPAALFGIAGGLIGSRLAIKRGVQIIRPVMLGVMALLLVKIAVDTFA